MNWLRRVFPWLGLIGTSVLLGCGRPGAEDSRLPLVVASTGMIGNVAEVIGGDAVRVVTLMGEGVDPHLYKPTTDDVKQLQAADVVFYNGLLLEGKMTDLFERIARSGKTVWAVGERAGEKKSFLPTAAENHHDPHVWMDVSAWMATAETIGETLADEFPAHAAAIQTRKMAYLAELEKLDDYARRSLASVPKEKRVLVTAHDAFGYMARAYDFEVRGIQGISTDSEAGLKDINALVDFLVGRRIPAVFVESSVPRKSVEALVEGARAKGHVVVIGGELFSDAMGRAGTYPGTYIGMIDHNVTTITRALGGEAPAKGMQGKLP